MARPASLICSRGVDSSSSTYDLREPERGEMMASYGGSQLGPWLDAREEDDTMGAKVGALDGGDVGQSRVARTIHQVDKCQWNGRKPAALLPLKAGAQERWALRLRGVGTVLRGTQPTDRAASRHTA
jgi:hypothetical protein